MSAELPGKPLLLDSTKDRLASLKAIHNHFTIVRPDDTEFPTHKFILHYHSRYFASILVSNPDSYSCS